MQSKPSFSFLINDWLGVSNEDILRISTSCAMDYQYLFIDRVIRVFKSNQIKELIPEILNPIQNTHLYTHTKGGNKRGPRGGEEPRSCPARGGREEWTVAGRGPDRALGNLKMMDPRACVWPALFIKNGTYINILRHFCILQGWGFLLWVLGAMG